VVANWGLGVSPVSNGILVSANGLAVKRDYQGELIAMKKFCAAFPPNAAAIFITNEGQTLMENVRAMCNVPAVQVAAWSNRGKRILAAPRMEAVVRSAVASVERAGRVPVLVAESERDLQAYRETGAVRHVFTLNTTTDPRVIYGIPKYPKPLLVDIWTWLPYAARQAAN
jgi:hypothetical protein